MRKRKRPRTEAQIAASRANGSLSIGSKTPEGIAKSALNSITHGFRAKFIALDNENREAYTAHLDAYTSRYRPADKVEEDLVGLLATNMWQLMRFHSVEVALLDLEMMDIEPKILEEFDAMDEWGRLALAFKKSSGDRALEVLHRYKTTAERAYHRALAALEKMRKERPAEPPQEPRQLPESKPDPQPEQARNNVVPIRKIGRNEPCPCHSGLKFKRCCISKPALQQRLA